jgi:hypothetical protein
VSGDTGYDGEPEGGFHDDIAGLNLAETVAVVGRPLPAPRGAR